MDELSRKKMWDEYAKKIRKSESRLLSNMRLWLRLWQDVLACISDIMLTMMISLVMVFLA